MMGTVSRSEKDEICDPSEYNDFKDEFDDLNKDGNVYTYNDELFPEFKTCSLKEAIEIVHKAITDQPG